MLRMNGRDELSFRISSSLPFIQNSSGACTLDNSKNSHEIQNTYRLLQYSLDNASDSILWFDDFAKLLYVNNTTCKILEYSREELMHMTIHDIVSNISKVEWRSFMTKLMENDKLVMNTSLQSRGTQEIPVEIVVQRLEMEEKVINFAYIHDVTESELAQQSIVQGQERNRIIVNAMSDLILVYDDDIRLIEHYTSDETLLFLPWKEMQNKRVEEFMPQEYVSKHYETIQKVKETGATSSFEYQLDISGDSKWFQGTVMMDLDTQKIVVAIKEITEKKSFEIALEKSEERLRNLIEQLPLGVVITNLRERIELANPAMLKILLLESDSPIGKSLLDYIKPDSTDSMREQTENRKLGKQSTYVTEMIRKDGEARHVRISAAPNFNNSGEVIGSVGIFEDITDQRANELIRARQEQEIRLYGNLLRHDLRNDLGLILSYIEAVQMLLETPDLEIQDFLNSSLASIERMSDLLEDFGRPQEMKDVDILEFIRTISDNAQEAEKNLHINVEYAKSTNPVRITAGNLLALVFMNLFRNSAQHAGDNPRIDVCVSRQYNYIEIIVSDDGPGVLEEFHDRLFSRGVSSKSDAGGLGLYLCRQIVENIGGTIELLDQSQGATFKILIPVGY